MLTGALWDVRQANVSVQLSWHDRMFYEKRLTGRLDQQTYWRLADVAARRRSERHRCCSDRDSLPCAAALSPR